MSGFFRKCNASTPGAEWAEGIGYYVCDDEAAAEGRKKMSRQIVAYWQKEEREALARLEAARAALRKKECKG